MRPTPPRPTTAATTTDGTGGAGVDPDAGADPRPGSREARTVRNNRATRWYHAAAFLTVFVLLGTGWWLRTGREGQPSLLAELLNEPDTEIHDTAGWVLVALVGVGLTVGVRGAWTFVRETLRVDRGDGRWFLRWPVGALTGRFGRHRGHFDPGQRIANVAFVVTLGTLIGSGVALTTLSGGSTFATLVKVHRGATYVLTALVIGHLVAVSGILPGYRGAWRAMIGRRGVRATTLRRLWPADADRAGSPDGNPHVTGPSPDAGGAGSHRDRD